MDGPTFLLLYAGVLTGALLGTRWFNRWRDARKHEPLPPVPNPVDPYEIAYLRGGSREAIRLAVYDLMQQGLLSAHEPAHQYDRLHKREVVANTTDATGLPPVARTVLRTCAEPKDPTELMRGELPQLIDESCLHWRTRDEEAGFLLSQTQRVQGWLLALMVAASLLFLSIWRIQDSLAHGHTNIIFLVLLTALAVVLVPAVGRPPERLTARGARQLKRLRHALAPDPTASSLRKKSPPAAVSTGSESSVATCTNDQSSPTTAPLCWSPAQATALVPIALYGMTAMPEADREAMGHLFPQASASTTSGCGSSSSCGSASVESSSDNSSDSGSTGGCGGGSCGGGGD